MPTAVTAVGLAALQRDWQALYKPGGPIDKAMSAAGMAAVAPVAALTRGAVPQNTGRLAATVRQRAIRTGGEVDMGDSGTRYGGWIEFGGWRRVPHESYRDYDSRGRFLFPSGLAGLAESVVERDYTTAIGGGLDSFR
ncbi:MAG TPA: hypothetical protein VGH66_16400, partial [Acidimicrobiales bacterium]